MPLRDILEVIGIRLKGKVGSRLPKYLRYGKELSDDDIKDMVFNRLQAALAIIEPLKAMIIKGDILEMAEYLESNEALSIRR